MRARLADILLKHQGEFHPVVPFNPQIEKISLLDLTEKNDLLTEEIVNDTDLFADLINRLRLIFHASYLIGGYCELRVVYGRSRARALQPIIY